MHPSSMLIALGFLPAILAAPGSQVQERASCTTAYPDIARISEAQPVESYLPGFQISQDSGATNKDDMLIEFSVPEGSTQCQLETFFPADYYIYKTGRQDVYVYSTDQALSRSGRGIDNSWAYSPNPVSQVGSIKFESVPDQDSKRVINSFVCKPTMTYRLSIGSDFTDEGFITYGQTPSAGLRMTYC